MRIRRRHQKKPRVSKQVPKNISGDLNTSGLRDLEMTQNRKESQDLGGLDNHGNLPLLYLVSSVQWLSPVWLFVTPWTATRQASLSVSNSRSLLKLMFIKLVMPSNHLVFCSLHLLLPSIFPSIRVFPKESALRKGDQSIGVSVSASVLPMNIPDWFPLRLTYLISL